MTAFQLSITRDDEIALAVTCGAVSVDVGGAGNVKLTAVESAVEVLLKASTLKEPLDPAASPVTVFEVTLALRLPPTCVVCPFCVRKMR